MDISRDEARVMAAVEPWNHGISIRIWIPGRDSFRAVTFILVELPKEEANVFAEPDELLRISPTLAQSLVNELWNIGIRPSDSRDAPGELDAVKAHLADIRVFHNALFEKFLKKLDLVELPAVLEERSSEG